MLIHTFLRSRCAKACALSFATLLVVTASAAANSGDTLRQFDAHPTLSPLLGQHRPGL